MKKLIAGLLATALAAAFGAGAFAQDNGEFEISALSKSGIFWQRSQVAGRDSEDDVRLHNKDGDSGNNEGRFQLDLSYMRDVMGVKARIRWDVWRGNTNQAPNWSYAFVYGDFFDEQFTLSVGKLGSSPWRTDGPELWKELEESTMGIRAEIKPAIVPGLNVGFVLNDINGTQDGGITDVELTIGKILQESVIGISYTHDLFLARFAYRLDSDLDRQNQEFRGSMAGEDEIIYRVEERALQKLLPGFQIWALGYFNSFVTEMKQLMSLTNWLFIQYDPSNFTAQIRVGYDVTENRSLFQMRPSFYYKFFDNMLNVGASFSYGQDFGSGKVYKGSPFYFIEAEPKVQFNFGVSSYVAFAYNFRREYVTEELRDQGLGPLKQIQWMNLRFCLTL